MAQKPKPKTSPPKKMWTPANATKEINKIAKHDSLHLALTKHVKEQMSKRDLLSDDILHVLQNGFVYEKGELSKRDGCFKYKIQGKSPNSRSREVRVVVKPNKQILEIITVMFVDIK